MHKAKHPQQYKDDHVHSKIHVPTMQKLIQKCNESHTLQRPTKAKIKTMWIPKQKEAMHPKVESPMAFKVAIPQAKNASPPSPKSILGPYVPKLPIKIPPSYPHATSISPPLSDILRNMCQCWS